MLGGENILVSSTSFAASLFLCVAWTQSRIISQESEDGLYWCLILMKLAWSEKAVVYLYTASIGLIL